MCVELFLVSQIISTLSLVKRIFVDISVLHRCCSAYVLPIPEYCSRAWGSPSALERQFNSLAWLYPEQSFLSSSYRHHIVRLCMLYNVISGSNHCSFDELPSASIRVRHIRAAAAAHPLDLESSRCRTSQFARCFLKAQVRMWNDLPFTVFDTGTLDGFKRAVNRWLLA